MNYLLASALVLGATTTVVLAAEGRSEVMKPEFILSEAQLDMVSAGVDDVNYTSGYGVVSADSHGADKHLQYPFTEDTEVPGQAAASANNESWVADGRYTAGVSPAPGSDVANPKYHVGTNYPGHPGN